MKNQTPSLKLLTLMAADLEYADSKGDDQAAQVCWLVADWLMLDA